ncbi:hypothetical protein LTR53_019499, partial [Teratosphaeriaceae sp. CCFEE 6253]
GDAEESSESVSPTTVVAPRERKAVARGDDGNAIEGGSSNTKRAATIQRAYPNIRPAPAVPEPREPPSPPRQPLTRVVAAKVAGVHAFLRQPLASPPLLSRDPSNPSLVTVTEIQLTAVLMVLRADYEISDPSEAHISDVEPAV